MKIRIYGLLLGLLLAVASGCSDTAGSKKQDQGHAEDEMLQVTAWSEKSELFMEYEPLQPGKKDSFLIHLTRLADGKPVAEGALKLLLRPASGEPLTITIPAPSRPGIYQAELTAPPAGHYTLELLPQGKGFTDRIELTDIQIGTAPAGAPPAKEETGQQSDGHAEHDDHEGHDHATEQHTDPHVESAAVFGDGGGTIALLKEQQWALDILIKHPERKRLSGQITASGELIAASDAEATVSAPLSGVLSVTKPLPYLGKRVAKGELIALIEPPIRPDGGAGQFSAAHAEARNRVTLASQEYERAQRLYQAKIAPRKRVEEAAAALDSARAALAPLEKSAAALGGDIGGRLAVRAPVAGTVVELFSGTGRGIEAGQPVVRIVNTGTLWLKVNLPAVDAGKLPRQPSASFTLAGQEGRFTTGRLISVGDMLDPQSRTLPVIFSIPNRDGRLKVGMFASVAVATGAPHEGLVLPAEALAEDEGRFFVFVQTSGERFTRREVQIGQKQGGLVQILKGLDDHERVVVQGAYYVKQATTTATKEDPHAGHAH
ncbi:MAG: efflux RND transporter periplasmic adaptor subunit [Elusimicrobiales bacterium]